jgi:hypothetical protein
MVYVVERYLPGVAPPTLMRALNRFERVTERVRSEGTIVRYLGSTIVPEDEACYCQFDAPSEAAVAEVNRRAGLRFDRIVAALALAPPDERRETR